jgi:hypothetical protein
MSGDLQGLVSLRQQITRDIANLEQASDEKRMQIDCINKFLLERCDHDWVTDYIDHMKGYRLSEMIIYCAHCELSRSF